MIDVVPMYEPRYYERSAQRHMARYLQNRLFINAPWGLSGSPASRPEIDAIALSEHRIMPIEIKAYELDSPHVENIIAKYRSLGFRRLIIVAPAVSDRAARSLVGKTPVTEFVLFRPQLGKLVTGTTVCGPHTFRTGCTSLCRAVAIMFVSCSVNPQTEAASWSASNGPEYAGSRP